LIENKEGKRCPYPLGIIGNWGKSVISAAKHGRPRGKKELGELN